MTFKHSRLIGVAVVGALAVLYAVLAHISNAMPGNQGLGLLLAVGPLWLIAAAMFWRSKMRWFGIALCVLGALLIYLYRAELEQHYPWIYLSQQVGAYGLLCLVFGKSLRSGRVPLCTQLALKVHDGFLPPEAVAYARRVTIAWTLFFGAMVTAMILIFLLASLSVWSAFANFGAAPLVALMFLAEHWVRGRALPLLPRTSLQATIRAFTAHRSRDAL